MDRRLKDFLVKAGVMTAAFFSGATVSYVVQFSIGIIAFGIGDLSNPKGPLAFILRTAVKLAWSPAALIPGVSFSIWGLLFNCLFWGAAWCLGVVLLTKRLKLPIGDG